MPDSVDPASHARDEAPDPVLLSYRRLLGHRFYVHWWVRIVVAVTIVVAAFVARDGFGFTDLDVTALTILAVVVALYDSVLWPLARRWRDPAIVDAELTALVGVSHAVIVLDFAAVTCGVWLVGGVRSPFVGLYALHVMFNAVVLSRRAALIFLALAYSLVVGLALVEVTGVAPPRLPEGLVPARGPLDAHFAGTLLVAHGVLLGATTLLLLGVTRALRRSEHRIHLANAELQRLSDQRRDFLRIALHNLKAPVGAVTMFLRNMRDGVAGPVADEHRVWLDRSLQRLAGLSEFMKSMSALSSIETDIIDSEFTRVDLAKVVQLLVEEYADVAIASRHSLSLHVARAVPPVLGSERLLREAVVNYLTNAIKYTPEHGRIKVRVRHDEREVRVEVQDDGAGIAVEDQELLFREFHRLRPSDPLMPKIEGTGLGLSIVHRVVLAHGGRVGVQSAPGRGSTFWLAIPVALD